jgi:signal transduction histidine kinase
LGTVSSSAQKERAYEIRHLLVTMRLTLAEAEASRRGYAATRDQSHREAFSMAATRWSDSVNQLQQIAHGDRDATVGAVAIEQLSGLGAAALSELRGTFSSGTGNGETLAAVHALSQRMIEQQDREIHKRRQQLLRDTWLGTGIAILTTVLTIAVLFALHQLLKRYNAARTQAEFALRAANQQLNEQVEERTAELSELSHYLIRASEEEKARIARELHDTLGSNLTAINMDINWVCKRLPETPELRERLQRALQMLSDTVELKHQVIEGLRPSHLDNLGLAFAMRTHCREFTRRCGVPCEVVVNEDFDDLNPDWSIALYRIVQEALTNITRHARAQSVLVRLSREQDGLHLRVEDDGEGIPAGAATRPSSHGLIGMRERMRQVGGTVRFASGADRKGTIVDAFIPTADVNAQSI